MRAHTHTHAHAYTHTRPAPAPGPTPRCESWDNYCELFGLLLHSNVNMQLPNAWLWDMVDEFLYQFQSFCQYRGKVRCGTVDGLLRSTASTVGTHP